MVSQKARNEAQEKREPTFCHPIFPNLSLLVVRERIGDRIDSTPELHLG